MTKQPETSALSRRERQVMDILHRRGNRPWPEMIRVSSPRSAVADAAAPHLWVMVVLVKATISLVAGLGITMAMQRASAGARHLVWLVTLGTLLVMPALTAWGPLPLRILPAASGWAPRIDRAPVMMAEAVSTPLAGVVSTEGVPGPAITSTPSPSSTAR